MKYTFCMQRVGPVLTLGVAGVLAALPGQHSVAQSVPPTDQANATAINGEIERIAREAALWPHFEPSKIPLAICTGEHTYLFRHPAPPEGFTRIADGAFVLDGRYPAITANSSADIGGTRTATLLASELAFGAAGADVIRRSSSVAIHEAFHVYQEQKHPSWGGNEAVAFLYPVENARLLGLRRLESLSWVRALRASAGEEKSCWAQRGLELRKQRFAAMDASFAQYERGTELKEGLARYVQLRLEPGTQPDIPAMEFQATKVRDRAYEVGAALAVLLDALRPGWQAALDANDGQSLDQMLEMALSGAPAAKASCAVTAAETATVNRTARIDAAAVATARVANRERFESLPGWRVVVESDATPLMLQGFDPLNVQAVTDGLLHRRLLGLGNAHGKLQMLQESDTALQAFTEAAGSHPLFNGVKRITIAGLAQPEVTREGSKVQLRSPGFLAEFDHVELSNDSTRIVLKLLAVQ